MTTPRKFFRAHFRNGARERGLLGQWAAWIQANIQAKLEGRRAECQRAITYAFVQHQKHGQPIRAALAAFWSKLLTMSPRATGRRVILRILCELGTIDKRSALRYGAA